MLIIIIYVFYGSISLALLSVDIGLVVQTRINNIARESLFQFSRSFSCLFSLFILP